MMGSGMVSFTVYFPFPLISLKYHCEISSSEYMVPKRRWYPLSLVEPASPILVSFNPPPSASISRSSPSSTKGSTVKKRDGIINRSKATITAGM